MMTNMSRPTKAERRRIGRAIRKERRELREAAAAVDWSALLGAVAESWRRIGEFFAQLIEVAAKTATAAIAAVARRREWLRGEASRAQRDWMLTHRAIAAAAL